MHSLYKLRKVFFGYYDLFRNFLLLHLHGNVAEGVIRAGSQAELHLA